MVLALVLNPNVQAKLQGIVTLILSFFLALGSLVLILVAFVKLLIMVALFFAAPFGTIAYLAIWGDFPKSAAAVILSLILLLKLGAAICLPLAQQRFLKLKSLILLIATSFLATIVVSFLHGIVPGPLVSITDALAAIIVGILALIWAVVILIGLDQRRHPGARDNLVMWPVTLRASWVASTKRCKDAGSADSGPIGATEDAAARRVIAGQEARERCRSHH